MTVQDDARERQLRDLFNLVFDLRQERAGLDAFLKLEGKRIPFELKSTTGRSVSTARDVGLDHLAKWAERHWLFGFYDKGGLALRHTRYGSPRRMRSWIDEKSAYVQPDWELAEVAKRRLRLPDLWRICGRKEVYAEDDAMRIQKKQYTKAEYQSKKDLQDGYSPERMLAIVRERLLYVCRRGSTLNNPHIPWEFLSTLPEIRSDHAATLRRLVSAELALDESGSH